MINKVYVIIGSSGSFDDHTTFIEGIFDNVTTAEETKDKINSEKELMTIEIITFFIEKFNLKKFVFDEFEDIFEKKLKKLSEKEQIECFENYIKLNSIIQKNNSNVIECDFNKRIELKNYF